jgi:nucleoside-diphosphate-sugar epimerase
MGTQHVIPEFILRLKNDTRKFEMFGGYQYRTFCYVTDAAKMTINLMNTEKANNKVVNIGNDQECVKISSIGDKLSQIMKISPKFAEKGAPKGSTEKRIPDLKQIRELGAYVSEVSFSQGLINTFEWYDERY